jgi:hypothetical protein
LLHDIAIVNDTLAYAVGEMYLRDSTGQIEFWPHNLARWNGRVWEYLQLTYGGIPPAIQLIFQNNSSDIWFDPWFRWDGQRFIEAPIDPALTGVHWTKMWGTQEGELYIVGWQGNIAYSPNHGASWQRISTGTSLDFQDILGIRNRSGHSEILGLASTYTVESQGVNIVRLSGGTATPVDVTGLAPDMMGLWFSSNRKYVVAGAGVYRKHNLNEPAWVQYPLSDVTRYYTEGVGGTDINDVFVCGSRGEVVHFNGIAWRKCFSTPPIPFGALGRISVTKHVVMAIGNIGGAEAVVLIGRR